MDTFCHVGSGIVLGMQIYAERKNGDPKVAVLLKRYCSDV
jgi:hypothetical protein